MFTSHRDVAFPAEYVFMTCKTHAFYQTVFTTLKDLVPTFNATQLMPDFGGEWSRTAASDHLSVQTQDIPDALQDIQSSIHSDMLT